MHLPVVKFKYKEEYTTDRNLQYGTIAEWALDLGLSEFIEYEEDGKVGGFKYDRLPIALLQVIQKQEKRIKEYEERLSRLEKLLQ